MEKKPFPASFQEGSKNVYMGTHIMAWTSHWNSEVHRTEGIHDTTFTSSPKAKSQ